MIQLAASPPIATTIHPTNRTMAVQVNDTSIDFLSARITEGDYVHEGTWQDDRPSNDAEISFIEEHGWNEFAKWHLALDTQANQFSKRRYEHLAGDFEKVHRSALATAYARAERLGFAQVKAAATRLIREMDEAAGGPPEDALVPQDAEEETKEAQQEEDATEAPKAAE